MEGLVSGRDPILHQVCRYVNQDEYIDKIIDHLWNVMYQNRGIGLAAPQVGIDIRMFVMDVNGFKQEFINPAITRRYGGKGRSIEGCLSYPGKEVKKIRHKQFVIEGFDANWVPVRFKLKGINAYCVQHEVDHLNGITIV